MPTNVNEVVVPLQDANHWSVVMSNESLIQYDPLSSTNLCLATLHWFLAKVWVAMQGKLIGIEDWMQNTTKNSWHWVHGPQQESDWECGFYVIKFIIQFYDHMNMHNVFPTMVCSSKLKNLSFKIYMFIMSYLHISLWVLLVASDLQ